MKIIFKANEENLRSAWSLFLLMMKNYFILCFYGKLVQIISFFEIFSLIALSTKQQSNSLWMS